MDQRGALHFSEDVIVARLEGDVEELAHLGKLRACFDQALCKIPAWAASSGPPLLKFQADPYCAHIEASQKMSIT